MYRFHDLSAISVAYGSEKYLCFSCFYCNIGVFTCLYWMSAISKALAIKDDRVVCIVCIQCIVCIPCLSIPIYALMKKRRELLYWSHGVPEYLTGQSHLILGTASASCIITSRLTKLCCILVLYKTPEKLDVIALKYLSSYNTISSRCTSVRAILPRLYCTGSPKDHTESSHVQSFEFRPRN